MYKQKWRRRRRNRRSGRAIGFVAVGRISRDIGRREVICSKRYNPYVIDGRCHALDRQRVLLTTRSTRSVASLFALGPWAPPAERGPSLESIYRVSLTVDLCEG